MDDQNANDPELYVHYNIDGKEFEAKGPAEQVNRHTLLYASLVAPDLPHGALQLQLPEAVTVEKLPEKTNGASPTLAGEDAPQTENGDDGNNTNHTTEAPDLITFYLSCPRESQREQVLLIGYYFKKIRGQDRVSLDEFRNAFAVLSEIPLQMPVNLTDIMNRNAKRKFMHKLDRGEFSLTITGQREVESWLAAAE